MKRSNKPNLPANRSDETKVVAAEYRGPIPPPNLLREYGNIVPDAPERILRVFEEDSAHTRKMQEKALEAEISRDTRAQWMAWSIMAASFALTAFLAYLGQLAAGTFSALATLFVAIRVLYSKKG